MELFYEWKQGKSSIWILVLEFLLFPLLPLLSSDFKYLWIGIPYCIPPSRPCFNIRNAEWSILHVVIFR
jgi:hypothetical protein